MLNRTLSLQFLWRDGESRSHQVYRRQSAVKRNLKKKTKQKKFWGWASKIQDIIQGLLLYFKNIKSFGRVRRKREAGMGRISWGKFVLRTSSPIPWGKWWGGGGVLNLPAQVLGDLHQGHFESWICVAWSLRNSELPQKICRVGKEGGKLGAGGMGGVRASDCYIWKMTSSPPAAGHKGAQDQGPGLPRLIWGLPRRPQGG